MQVHAAQIHGLDSNPGAQASARKMVPANARNAKQATALEMVRSDRVYLWVEFASLFFLIPTLLLFRGPSQHWVIFAAFVLGTLGCYVVLRRDRGFDRKQLWNWAAAKRDLPRIIGLFLLFGAATTYLVWSFLPERFLNLPREMPGLWLRIMLIYPLISVIPQELIWRVFCFQRYRVIFRSPTAMILASSVAFAYVHVLLENSIAIALTFVGGLLFSYTYHKTRSLAAASIEHALYGCMVFTIGLGWYFYMGSVL